MDLSIDLRDLQRLVALGEGLTIEFKRRVPRPERIAKEVIALANTQGGKLLLGVDDDGTIKGVRDAHEEAFALRQAIAAHTRPLVPLDVTAVPVSRRREVLVVDVPESAAKPHYLVATDAEGRATKTAYVRVDEQSIEASREVIRVMKAEQNPTNTRFEFGDKEQKLMQYLDRYERITVAQFAKLAGVSLSSAAQTLVLLTRASILALHPDEKADYWTLAYDVV
ncbi:MAG: ATP-binding protein [Bacteroidota bacterium]